MKKILLLLTLSFFVTGASSQTPTYYYYNPANVGVNNLYFNTGVSYKFLFIYSQSELASTGITTPIEIHSLWLKSNTGYPMTYDDLKITLGHTTLATPSTIFADNFNSGASVVVLNEATFNVAFNAGPWNDPPDGWTEIPLTTPFTYNFSDNLAIQMEYSDDNYPIPLYAYNGGPAITQYTDTYGGTIATANTARPMIGFSTLPASPVFVSASDSTLCQKFCIDFTDLSLNNPVSWNWTFEGGTPATSSAQNPTQVCYNNSGSFDVTLITTDSLGESDTLFLPDFISVFPTPALPTITQSGNTLMSSAADFYQWQFNLINIPGATNQTYVANQSGLYTIVTSDSSGCFSSASLDVSLTGIDYIDSLANPEIYPNPSSGVFVVTLDHSSSKETSLCIFNTAGGKVTMPKTAIGENGFMAFFIDTEGNNVALALKWVVNGPHTSERNQWWKLSIP